MSRTGLDPADIAKNFRDRCGDGSMEWVTGPMQTWLLLDAADMLDEGGGLRELVREMWATMSHAHGISHIRHAELYSRTRELGVEVDE